MARHYTPLRGKEAYLDEWPKILDAEIPDGSNRGLMLGPSGLVDVDCDCDFAVRWAEKFLPPTSTFGQAGARAHWIYECPDAEGAEKLAGGPESRGGVGTLLELRSGDLQTMCPPSIHPDTGREIAWTNSDEPAVLCWQDLLKAWLRLAVATAAHELGTGHDAMLALAGGLGSLGWPEAEAAIIVEAATDTGDVANRLSGVFSTYKRIADGGIVAGWKQYIDLVSDKRCVNKMQALAKRLAELEQWSAIPTDGVALSGIAADDAAAIANVLIGDPTLFVRGGVLVRVRDVGDACGNTTCVIETHDEHSILEPLARFAPTYVATKDGRKRADPSERTVKALLRGSTYPTLRELADVSTMPVIRPDGSVATSRGWDPDTKIFLANSHEPGPEPTRAAALEALAELEDLVSDFPLTAQGRLAWLAGVLTLACRSSIDGPVPMWIFDAPSGGSGKTLLCKLMSLCGTGHAPSPTPVPSVDESRKTYFASGASGRAMLWLDNCDRRSPESDALEQVVTAASITTRLMRQDREATVPFRCVVVCTGNNVSFSSTFERRALRVRLSVPTGARSFRLPNIEEHTKNFSARYLTLAQTVARAFLTAAARPSLVGGSAPAGGAVLPSFEAWSAVVPAMLAWLGRPTLLSDAAEGRAEYGAGDDWRGMAVERIAAWAAGRSESLWTARDLWDRIAGASFGTGPRELREALEGVLGVPLKTAVQVGRALARLRDYPVSGSVLQGRVGRGGVLVWRVVPCDEDTAAEVA